MTDLYKPITRLTYLEHNGYRLAVTLDPGKDGKPEIIFHAKGQQWKARISVSEAFHLALNKSARLSDEQIKVMLDTKIAVIENPKVSTESRKLFCDSIDEQLEREKLVRMLTGKETGTDPDPNPTEDKIDDAD